MIEPGELVMGRYLVDAQLGKGGMGQVVRAQHTALGHHVAIKVLTDDDRKAHDRFLREARAMAAVSHPHVARIIDIGRHADHAILIMELIDGQSLERRLEQFGPLRWDYACQICAQVARGLAAIHRAELLHRDIKPANIMMTRAPELAKIVDFGIVKLAHADELKLTKTGLVVGTPAYMAPEHLTGQPLTPAADIYALATMLWELVCGALPFGAGYASAMARVTEEPPPPVTPVNLPDPPDVFSSLLVDALHRDPEQRTDAADAFAEALEHAARGQAPPPRLERSTRTRAALDSDGPVVTVARLPAAALTDREERQWLTRQLPEGARSYAISGLLVVIGPPRQSERNEGLQAHEETMQRTGRRYGPTVRWQTQRAPSSFRLSPAALTGLGRLPEPLAAMIALL